MPELLFHGAAGEVTGSMHLVQADGHWIALDCGLFQGRRAETEEKNRAWPMPPKELKAVVLSHAHTDHTGRLPRLVRDGFDGPIFCTPATRDLCAYMLPDSAHIQEEDVFYSNKKRRKRGLPPIEALYTNEDAVATLKLMQTVPNDRWFGVINGVRASFREAGHILGSAGIHLAFAKRNGTAPELYFSGDVGRRSQPIIHDPLPFPPCDVLICESTYGGSTHNGPAFAREQLFHVIERTLQRGGKVLIPAFSVGRTQALVYSFQEWFDAGKLPCVPVYVDSPLAIHATNVFRGHPELFDTQARELQTRTKAFLRSECVTYIHEVEDSKALHKRQEPCVIISASGMCEAGRIRHHIKNNIGNARNTLLLPGYQAENTLGRKLADGAKKIKLFEDEYDVRAEVVQLNGFSAHADQPLLLECMAPVETQVGRVFLVHGETEPRAALAAAVTSRGMKCESPAPNTRFSF